MQSKPVRILLLAGLLIAAALPLAAADEATTKVTVRNKAPSVEDAEGPQDDVVPVPGGTTLVPVTLRASDPNGHADLEVSLSVYREDDDDDLVLHRASVAVAGIPVAGTSDRADFPHSISMNYYDPPGDYVAVFRVADKGGASPQLVEVEFEYGELVALHLVESMLDFGELEAGKTSPQRTTTIRNYGNVEIDLRATGTDLTGPQGTIPATSLLGDGAPLSGQGLLLDLDLEPGAGKTERVDWELRTPHVAPGEYQGRLSLAAVASD